MSRSAWRNSDSQVFEGIQAPEQQGLLTVTTANPRESAEGTESVLLLLWKRQRDRICKSPTEKSSGEYLSSGLWVPSAPMPTKRSAHHSQKLRGRTYCDSCTTDHRQLHPWNLIDHPRCEQLRQEIGEHQTQIAGGGGGSESREGLRRAVVLLRSIAARPHVFQQQRPRGREIHVKRA
ncbi:hypothetical protein AAFF_G00035710 [Aldrovandia affinis]|uniref:Uncharacterized protein n=1 Tax=Aldrovandia affinis TaxID=143900 RepID=A0AAD7WFW1_9TELE|nr:hypothetical protein AAFF_G00035710 [Aldrovandia affinis]